MLAKDILVCNIFYMTWKNYLKENEKMQLHKASNKRNLAQAELTALRRKIQSRCESRMRQANAKNSVDNIIEANRSEDDE